MEGTDMLTARRSNTAETRDDSVSLNATYLHGEYPTTPYVYGPLSPDQIRLLILLPGAEHDPLHARLEVVRVEDRPKYKAISYAWGDPIFPHPLQLPTGRLHITDSLFGALRRFRSETASVVLWADAVCIDQANVAEKNHQVAMFDQTFSEAEEVLVWLGDAEESDCMTLHALKHLATLFETKGREVGLGDRRTPVWINTAPSETHACPQCHSQFEIVSTLQIHVELSLFWQRRWFSRLWVIQEVYMAERYTFYFGRHSLPSRIVSLASSRWANYELETLGNSAYYGWKSVTESLLNVRQGPEPRLLETMMFTSQLAASDVRDRVYALRRVANIKEYEAFKPDYSLPLRDLWTRVAVLELSSLAHWEPSTVEICPLVLLALAGVQNAQADTRIPSWVPDFQDLNDHCQRKYREYQRHSLGNVTREKTPIKAVIDEFQHVLQIQGKIVSRVDEICVDSSVMLPSFDHAHAFDDTHQHLISMYAACFHFRATHTTSPPSDAGSMKVLLMQGFPSNQQASRSHYDRFLEDLDEWRWRTGSSLHPEIDLEAMFEDLYELMHPSSDLVSYLDRTRVLASTVDGHVGWVPASSQPDDVVTAFWSSPRPFVLRPQDDGYYRVVGDALIQGIETAQARPEGKAVEWIEIK